MKRSWLLGIMGLLLVVGVGGCPKTTIVLPETVGELRDVAVQGEEEARAAREARDPGRASDAADRAEAARKKAAEKIAATTEPSEADQTSLKQAASAARSARRHARLAEEDKRLDAMRNSWKGKAYRAGRQAALPGACKGLALAADEAARVPPEQLPEPVRGSAQAAAGLAEQYAGRKPLANGQPDWSGIATDLRGIAAAPPPQLGLTLALAFVLTGRKEFALYEIEMIDPAALTTPQEKTNYHLLRGFICTSNGLPLLGVEEVEKVTMGEAVPGTSHGPELLAGMHLLLAYLAIEGDDYERADREVVRAMQVYPNNPISVFLTGERQAATGEYEEAAASLEKAASGTDQEWLAKKVAQRARELRDNPGESQTLLHDNDFLREVFFHYLKEAAKKSEPAQRLQKAVQAAQDLGRKVLEQLPGMGES
jgi:hypothetical protein